MLANGNFAIPETLNWGQIPIKNFWNDTARIRFAVFPNTKFGDQRGVTASVFGLEVVQQLAAAAHHAQQASTTVVGVWLAQRKMERRVELPVQPVTYRSDAGTIERGKYLYASRGCAECHGNSGTG
eukprot:gene59025-78756_t